MAERLTVNHLTESCHRMNETPKNSEVYRDVRGKKRTIKTRNTIFAVTREARVENRRRGEGRGGEGGVTDALLKKHERNNTSIKTEKGPPRVKILPQTDDSSD